MKAIAVTPGQAGSAHVRELPAPRVTDVPDGRGVLVEVLRVGLDGTDAEINDAHYGTAPTGEDFLVLGHESLGVVREVGPAVEELAAGELVVAVVRRPGGSLYDRIGMPDMTTDDVYREHGISLLHGFLTELYVDGPDYLVPVPPALGELGVLLEPMSIVEKGVTQAYEIQRRLRLWRPRRAAVLGAGTIGLLATLALRLRGVEVTAFDLEDAPFLNSDLAEALGARYLSTRRVSLTEAADRFGPYDLVFEATGYSPLAFEAMGALGRNGVLVLSSITGGDRTAEVPADELNLGFVLGNKVMVGSVNANRAHFEEGVRDFTLAEARWPGWLRRLLTHPVRGLDDPERIFESLGAPGEIKVYVEVAPMP